MFTRRHQDRYTGGTYFLNGPLRSSTNQGVLADVDVHRPSIVRIDNIDSELEYELKGILDGQAVRYPNMCFLMTADRKVLPTPQTVAIELPRMTAAEVLSALNSGYRGDPARLATLADQLTTSPDVVEAVFYRLVEGTPPESILDWLENGAFPVARDVEGHPLGEHTSQHHELTTTVTEVSDDLIKHLAKHPELLYELDPTMFERLVAELYRRRGYEATLTPASGDKGVDVYVVSRDGIGKTLWVVQAKRWAAHRKIGAGVVRELYGTVNLANASAGILLTTSFFEPGAYAIERELRYRIKLDDYISLQQMLQEPRGDTPK